MKPMREKIQSKLNSMASILIDDIVVPEQDRQNGSETITAGFFDKYGNKFTFTLTLDVVEESKVEEVEDGETGLTVSEQIGIILDKLTRLEGEVAELKTYHTQNNDVDDDL